MSDRFTRVLLVVLVALIGLYVAEPFVDRLLFTSGEPRVITPRGELAPAEQTTVTLFQTVAPSVVQVVAGSRGGQLLGYEITHAAIGSGNNDSHHSRLVPADGRRCRGH